MPKKRDSGDKARESFEETRKKKRLEAIQKAYENSAEAYASDNEADKKGWNGLSKKELESEWENLRRHAIVTFPEGVEYTHLSGNNKLVAIADVLGWSQTKISKASGIARSTIQGWLRRPDVKKFQEEFRLAEYHESEDAQKVMQKLFNKVAKFYDRVMSDTRDDPSIMRVQDSISKRIEDRTLGKAPDHLNVSGLSFSDMLRYLKEEKLKDKEDKKEDIPLDDVSSDYLIN